MLYLKKPYGSGHPAKDFQMKPSNELFDLIKSLTKSEKRFFKLHSSLQSGEKNYLRIFDAVDRQKEYDEEAIKKQFAKETFVRHFPSEKNHLYKLILKALRAFHAESSITGVLKQHINNIEILFGKALYEEANKVLVRAKRIAREHERFYLWFELLAWEKNLLEEAYQSGNFTQDLEALIREEEMVLAKLKNLATYNVLYSKINYVFRSGGYVRTDEEHAIVEEISGHPLIKGKDTALSNRASTICHYTQGFCSWARRDWATSYAKFRRVKEILDKHPQLRKDLPKRYVRTLYYLIQCEIELGDHAHVEQDILKLRALPEEPGFGDIDIRVLVFCNSHLVELRLYDRTGEFTNGLALEPEVERGMAAWGNRLPKEYELEFYFLLSTVNFGAGQMNRALYWLNKVLNDPEPMLRQDIFTYARLFNLVVHYELGNYDLLEYIVRSTQRYLSKRQRAYGVEAALIEHIRKLARNGTPAARHALFVSLRRHLDALMQDPNESTVLKYFNICAWVDSKVDDLSFAEVVKRKQAAQAT
ncbi:MAG: hypothetical protein J5I62_00015 [Flavobacteriales bacterium]|nr:hypothetical protein [Flavobacteriales bacterium]MEB2340779.1 hypothetical protein [Flavobacteriia bacterium]